ncbi:hypothetical protein [Microvirga sp. VF16]|uniref:hypothetical protein n=1 Tax=Microvirga sp. VF16 TaxID=2807101 RepID=UPI00193E0B0E|nr:hypothetical protein [Microvirga sp. VF16]QRM34847.1 hypothetical protein JO965_42055 [Microvirga sp. VF16]
MISPHSIHSAEVVLEALAGTSRAELAIETYERTAGMVGNTGIQIWHLILSLMDLCETQGSHFDVLLQQAQIAFAKDVAGKPDAQVQFLLFDLMTLCKSRDIDFAEIIANLRAERPIINGDDTDA